MDVILSFLCGGACVAVVGVVIFYLWISKAFRFW